LVIDANSGEVLHASNADSLRHPASLTKIMTLYLLFEEIEAGRLSLDTELPISAEAASQAPSKLGLRAGRTITVEEAIKALVTKSANDAAVVIAESLASDEDNFAKRMTRKARALGMTRTVYRNASGLPDSEQVTTARDQVLLGRAIQDRFPRFYRYFSLMSFNYRGKALRNHNHLLGRVEGVDGIKTGYTHASGFNLVTSVRRGNRHIVAAVFGGRSAAARDSYMRGLIEQNIADASVRRTAPKIIEAAAEPTVSSESGAIVAGQQDPQTLAPTNILPTVIPTAGSLEPIQARRVKTLAVKPSTRQTASLLATSPNAAAPRALRPMPDQGSAAVNTPSSPHHNPTSDGPNGSLFAAQPASPQSMALMSTAAPPPPVVRRGGWLIQIGAFEMESEAKQRLQTAVSAAKGVLARADPFTERVVKGDKTLYRARFAGFDKDGAQAACKHLKRNDFACLALKN
jgi:D-alanyl-D-alanine carboxypeptidase